MKSIFEVSVVLHEHAKEIMKLARRSGKDRFRILAEVDSAGQWRGAGIVTPGTGSLLAYEGRGFAAYFDCSPFRSLADIHEQIDEWFEQKVQQLEA